MNAPAYSLSPESPRKGPNPARARLRPPGGLYCRPRGPHPRRTAPPDPIRDEQTQLLQQVVLDASDLDGKLAAAEQKMNTILAQRDSWPILERRYKHNDLMIPNQP